MKVCVVLGETASDRHEGKSTLDALQPFHPQFMAQMHQGRTPTPVKVTPVDPVVIMQERENL